MLIKRCLFYGLLVFIWFLSCNQIVLAQPLDPSLPGYEEIKPPARPKLKIVSPKLGDTILGPRVSLEYIISGIKLIKPSEKLTNKRGEGHLKIIFAREGYPVPPSLVSTDKSAIKFDNIPEGKYRITIEVVTNNDASFSPPIQETTKFEVISPSVPTLKPSLTPPPNIFTILKSNRPSRQETLISLGLFLIILPPIYLFLRKK